MRLFPENINITKIYSVQQFDAENGAGNEWDFYPEPRYCYELIFHLDGEADIFFQGKCFHAAKNCMTFLPKGIVNADYHVHRFSLGRCIDVFFETNSPMPESAIHIKDSSTEMRNRFVELLHIWSSKSMGYYTRTMSQFYGMITLQNSYTLFYLPQDMRQRLQTAGQYIEAHYLDPNFDCHVLAELSGLSYSYFRKLFTAAHGMPPARYVANMRMNYAKELLISNKFSVSEIAERCGYSDIYYFSSAFKRIFGKPPSAYKQTRERTERVPESEIRTS